VDDDEEVSVNDSAGVRKLSTRKAADLDHPVDVITAVRE